MGEKAEEAMNLAVKEVQGLPEYSVKGEVSISWTCNILIHIKWFVVGDHRCWHDSTANAYHKTVLSLSGRYVGIAMFIRQFSFVLSAVLRRFWAFLQCLEQTTV